MTELEQKIYDIIYSKLEVEYRDTKASLEEAAKEVAKLAPLPPSIDKDILADVIRTWGEDSQVEMIQEECLELALAIRKLGRRDSDPHKARKNVIDEIADVKIMIAQAELIFPKVEIDKRVAFKMERLSGKLAKRKARS